MKPGWILTLFNCLIVITSLHSRAETCTKKWPPQLITLKNPILASISLVVLITLSACSSFSGSKPIQTQTSQSKGAEDFASSEKTISENLQPIVLEDNPEPIAAQQVVEKPLEEPEFWQKVRDGYQLDLSDLPLKVQKQRDWYLENPNYLRIVLKRAEPFIFYVADQLDTAGLPLELVFLPIIESTYDPLAYSPSHAAGLWQFIPSTARQFGLERDRWYDGRRDVVQSTEAAITYLSYLHRRFDGDWLLALAAYNSGEGFVSKSIRRNLREGKPTDFWNVKLPRETRNYVPQLLALASIISDPKKYNVTLPEIPFEPYFTSVQVNHQIALSTIIDVSGVSPSLFTQLNAAYRRSITPPEGSYQILLPRANAKDFRHFINTTNPRTWIPHKEYIIASGDTLSHIALRFNVPVSSIKKRNGLLGDRLTIGNTLYIPEGDGEAMVVPKIMRYKTISHIVTSGDTLSSLAVKYGTSVRDLRAQNGLNSELIRIGQALDILVPSASTKSTKLRRLFYTVKSGDSLYLIAKKFSLLISDITRWNKISREEYLQPGQKLTLFINPRII